jgi:predicted site-specific integrase-resolvase
MTLDEVVTLFGVSRRTVMRWVDSGKLPPPTDSAPFTWSAADIKAARKRIRDEERQRGRGHAAAVEAGGKR